AESGATECGRALGDGVDVLEDGLRDGVVELVELDEVAALDVPVRLLELRVQVEAVREPGVQELDELLARVCRDVDAGLERPACLRRHVSPLCRSGRGYPLVANVNRLRRPAPRRARRDGGASC